MEFDAILLPPRRAEAIAKGWWHDRTINQELDACAAACPDKIALTAVRSESGELRRFSYRELAQMADRIAVGLSRLGVGRDDVVAMQLPNWWQFSLLYLACSRIGAVLNPLMHIFRERELSFMLEHGQARLLVVPKTFRGFDHEAMARALQPRLPSLQRIVVVDGGGADDFDALLTTPEWETQPDARDILTRHRPGPDDITQLIYTSGTTGEPKGVMHSANTLMANIVPYAERLKLGADDVVLMASPMAHQTGFMYGLMMPIMLRAGVVLQDVWDARKAVELVRGHRVSFTMASTPFLADLTKTVQDAATPVPSLKTFLCAGAPIPGALVEQARRVLGTKIVSAWGMTENGAVTLIKLDDDDERAFSTDGCALPGVEVKVVDFDGRTLPPGEAGKLLVRTCSNFGGYLHRPQWNNTDAEGWFDTGDLARIDAQGYIRISGRSKDVIIRGGENIPVFEIEALLYRHPAVAQVAIVAYADERLGERACAVVVPKPGCSLEHAGMVEFLKSQKVALQYIPERLVVRDAMPATPSGKIQKFKLRDMLRDGSLRTTAVQAAHRETTMRTDAPILTDTSGRVGLITLHRPKQLNALNDALMDALGRALLAFDGDEAIGAIVITGGAKAFAAGADIAAMAGWSYMDVYRSDFITRNWETIRRVRKPVLAAVAGFAMGGGCELALACDIVIAAESAKFALPEIKLAMLPGAGGTQRLPRAIGKAKAMDMCLSARVLDATEADRCGLVSRVVPDAQLLPATLALAAQIAGYSLPALMAIKESVNRAYESALGEGIGFERRQLHARFASDDAHEGMKAFLEKRPPVFTHR